MSKGTADTTAGSPPYIGVDAGEWQTMYIRYEGVNIQVKLNGEEIVNSDISAFKDRAKDHPGVLRTAGFIGLQNHGSRLDYRNIKLRELP